jgi:tRNA dimethylallyltransferase
MQVYRDLRVVTARPTHADEARVPHRLYGHVDAAETYSTGHWLRDVASVLTQLRAEGALPVLVGGTGLYFKLLSGGIATVPAIPSAVRDPLRRRLAEEGPEALHAELARLDPPSAERLSLRDGTRIVRALEVIEATGRPLRSWHDENAAPLLAGADVAKIFLAPDRTALRERIEKRFDAMMTQGALEEVRALAARGLDPLSPVMKAHGVPWLVRHLRGEISLDAAVEQAKADTRRYAKRQFTWFRNQLPDWTWAAPQDAARLIDAQLGA